MEEIIIIRALDQGGELFKTIMDIVYHSSVHIIETRSTVLAFGDIEIHTDCRRVLKTGKDIRINHSEYAMLYCMAKAPGRIYTMLEPGEIDHSESSRNNQSKLIRNSQCTLTD